MRSQKKHGVAQASKHRGTKPPRHLTAEARLHLSQAARGKRHPQRKRG